MSCQSLIYGRPTAGGAIVGCDEQEHKGCQTKTTICHFVGFLFSLLYFEIKMTENACMCSDFLLN